ncbi:GNAT family N-acetyltransferase [Aspergillus homomorphus CBS 101889]|uniref:N-acetyltransferase domain-containing protein n=1 Tax=Aspergillus homomorphus (strain CBS 101889) TaxID=1450537 RepID=A0A395I056_ASPHC|nr:hypothetical protein BO97DRAFT_388049 [Aspergillus homomorphus CBS 101889]RAL13581.1 hypothetical protein BO97DRAFT_388049 [Aspergillus homomorphus CBS 101889]
MTPITQPPSLVLRFEQAEEIHVIQQAKTLQKLYPSHDLCIQRQQMTGGVAIRTLPQFEGKLNRAVGLSLRGPFTLQVLRELESTYATIGLHPEIHLCEYADPSAWQVLARAGYFSKGTLSVYYVDLENLRGQSAAACSNENLKVTEVTSNVDRERFAAASIAGFADGGRSEELLGALARIATLRDDTSLYIATTDGGKVVGTAALGVLSTDTLGGSVGHLYLDSTVPGYRGMGAHAALIHARLRVAQGKGLKSVTLSTRQGSGSARNAEKAGFRVTYRKEILVKG